MGFFEDIQNKASDLLGGAGDVASDVTANAGDVGADMQDQIAQYAEEHNISLDAAKEHFLGQNN